MVVCASDPRAKRVDHEVLVEQVSPNGRHAFLRPVAADGHLWHGYWVGVGQYCRKDAVSTFRRSIPALGVYR